MNGWAMGRTQEGNSIKCQPWSFKSYSVYDKTVMTNVNQERKHVCRIQKILSMPIYARYSPHAPPGPFSSLSVLFCLRSLTFMGCTNSATWPFGFGQQKAQARDQTAEGERGWGIYSPVFLPAGTWVDSGCPQFLFRGPLLHLQILPGSNNHSLFFYPLC